MFVPFFQYQLFVNIDLKQKLFSHLVLKQFEKWTAWRLDKGNDGIDEEGEERRECSFLRLQIWSSYINRDSIISFICLRVKYLGSNEVRTT